MRHTQQAQLVFMLLILGVVVCPPLVALDIYEDTVWMPEESPYIFYEHVFVHEGVTLTILPGTEIQFESGYADAGDDFYAVNGECVAKLMWVDGSVIAVGTEDEPIMFTGTIDEPNYRWGCVYLSPESGTSVFLNCHFERAAYISWTITTWFYGAIHCANGGDLRVEHCTFLNCNYSVYYYNLEEPQYLYANTMIRTEEELHSSFKIEGYECYYTGNYELRPNRFYARNRFNHCYSPGAGYGKRIFNNYYNINVNEIEREPIFYRVDSLAIYSYGNYLENCDWFVGCSNSFNDEIVFARKNTLINSDRQNTGIRSTSGNIHISDNILIDSGSIYTGENTNAQVYNNLIIDGSYNKSMELLGSGSAWNNIIYNTHGVILGENFDRFCNNTFYGNIDGYVFWHLRFQAEVYNNILYTNHETLCDDWQTQYPLFHHNWMSHNISSIITDGGGNIVGDDPGLADPANGDFSLAEGSPCIDAGVSDSLWYAFDGLHSFRIADGDGDGIAEVDIGAWERASSYRGCIEGYVFEEDGVTPLDITELELTGMLPEWSDSTGYFRFDCGPGDFTLTADHFYYDAQTVGTYSVSPGEMVFVVVTMTGCAVEDPEELLQPYILQSSNYPNPFNPTTTIRYSIPAGGHVELSVYNIKGQKVTTLVTEHQQAGEHEITWDAHDYASGIYFYRLHSRGLSRTGKMLLLK